MTHPCYGNLEIRYIAHHAKGRSIRQEGKVSRRPSNHYPLFLFLPGGLILNEQVNKGITTYTFCTEGGLIKMQSIVAERIIYFNGLRQHHLPVLNDI